MVSVWDRLGEQGESVCLGEIELSAWIGRKRTNRERRVPELGLLIQYALQWRKVLRGQPATRCDAGASGPHEGSHRNGDPGHDELQLKLQCTTTAL